MKHSSLSRESILEEDEEEEESYSMDVHPETSTEEAEKERWERSGRIYRNIVKPVLQGLDESFRPSEVKEEIRPPYSLEEIETALKYGLEEEDLEYSNGYFST